MMVCQFRAQESGRELFSMVKRNYSHQRQARESPSLNERQWPQLRENGGNCTFYNVSASKLRIEKRHIGLVT